MTRHFDIVAMGDINLDTVVPQFLPYEFTTVTNNRLTFASIEESYGGSGLIFCLQAEKFGCSAFLLSKVGDDLTGNKIQEELNRHPLIEFPQSLVSKAPTGHAIIIRDQAQVRLLVNNDNNANFQLTQDDVARCAHEIDACKVLHISGYCIKERGHPRFQATLQAMEIARRGQDVKKPAIILDVVPHRIYEDFTFSEFYAITQNVDILVSEVATMRRFLGLGDRSETIDRELAFETLTKASRFYRNLVLRFGPSGCDSQVAWCRQNQQTEYLEDTGHSRLDPAQQRGFGDILTLNALKNFYQII
jgi:sugar/nucleoside kinase (ribokinase family)